MKELIVSQDEMISTVQYLSTQIHPLLPFTILSIARGGSIPAYHFSEILGVRRIYSIGIECYDGKKRRDEPFIYQDIHTPLDGRTVCIIDDIADSGTSLRIAEERAFAEGAEDVIVCTLFCKSNSTYRPNFFYEEVDEDTWVVFPWELE